MTGVGVLGPWPGTRVLETQATLLGDLGDVPEGVEPFATLVQLPERGPWGDSVGRTVAVLEEMPAELGPHGWRLCDRPGRDLERARALLREDLEALAATGQGWGSPLALSVRGPWTFAAQLWTARADRVLADPGAVRDLSQSLAEGVAGYVRRAAGALPGASPVVVLREPMLPDVLGGAVATFSGHGRLRAPDPDEARQALTTVVDAARAAGASTVVVHTGARQAARSLRVAAGVGADAVGVSLAGLAGAQWELLAEAVERGTQVWFGLPRERHGRLRDVEGVAESLTRPWRAVGLPRDGLARVTVHVETAPTVAGGDLVLTTPRAVRSVLAGAVRVARAVADEASG